MNVLLDKFPTKIQVNNKIYEIDSDFRTGITIFTMFEDNELTQDEKYELMLELLYKDKIPDKDIEEACIKAIKFLDGGEEQQLKFKDYYYDDKEDDFEQDEEENPEPRFYSFTKDSKYMYSSIKQTYRIDLESIEYMHLWKFINLFLDLNNECVFSQMVYLRRQKYKGKLTKEERQLYYSMREILDLDYEEELEEESEFDKLLKQGVKNNEQN